MKRPDAGRPSLEDARFDELMRDFFAREMPAELRRSDNAFKASAPRPKPSYAPLPRDSVLVQVSAVAVCLLLAGTVLWFSSASKDHGVPVVVPDRPIHLAEPKVVLPESMKTPTDAATRPAGFSWNQNVEPVESLTYDTVNGPVQQRTNLSTTNVSFIEPETGDLLELSLPELTIEIFPIEQEAAGVSSDPNHAGPSDDVGDAPVLLPEQESGSAQGRKR